MNTALLAIGVFATAFVTHLVWWRIRLPRRQTAVLLSLFFSLLVAWLVDQGNRLRSAINYL